jgi:hypothetical protein
MSGAVTPHIPVRQQLARDKRRGQIVAGAVVTFGAALLVAFALAVSGDEAPTTGSDEPVAAQSTALSQPSSPVDGIRYDGGPEEGAVGTVAPPAPSGIRYDGGPDEGAVGTVAPPPPSGLRYDGGPEEGSRGPAAAVR